VTIRLLTDVSSTDEALLRTCTKVLGCRRLGIRYERRDDILFGLLHLACSLICARFLTR
jgi:hypothetical protein